MASWDNGIPVPPAGAQAESGSVHLSRRRKGSVVREGSGRESGRERERQRDEKQRD